MSPREGFRLRPSLDRRGPVPQAPALRPTVSVVIANYNYARFLRESIGSALSQSCVDVEVIVVDDLSTDGSVSVAGSIAAAEPRVRLIERLANGGPVAAFNDGLEAATGEYLIRLDADDLLTPGSVARATALAEQHPTVGLVYGHPQHFSGGSEHVNHRGTATGWTVWPGSDWVELRCRLGHNCITSPEVVMRMSVVTEVGGMRPLPHTHDLEWWMRIARVSDVGWLATADQALHRKHDDSLSAREVDVIRDLEERAVAFETLFTDGQGDPATDARMLALARDSLAGEAVARATQAYAAGRGGSEETIAYLAYVERVRGSAAGLPRSGALDHALRLGAARARLSPVLIALAVLHRRELIAGHRRWLRSGV